MQGKKPTKTATVPSLRTSFWCVHSRGFWAVMGKNMTVASTCCAVECAARAFLMLSLDQLGFLAWDLAWVDITNNNNRLVILPHREANSIA